MTRILLGICCILLAQCISGAEPVVFFKPEPAKVLKVGGGRTLIEEDGLPVMQIQTDKSGYNVVAIPVDTALVAGKKVTLIVETAQENISAKPKPWNGVKVMFYLEYADGRKNYPQADNVSGSRKWMERAVSTDIPADVKRVDIVLGLEQVTGKVKFRNVRLEETSAIDYSHYTVTGRADKDNALYNPGEPMKFTFQLLNNGKPAAGMLRIVRAGDDGKRETTEHTLRTGEPLSITTSMDRPGFAMVRAILLDRFGNSVKNKNGRPIQYGVAGGVQPEKLTSGVPEPADFDAFWAAQKKKLAAVPAEVLEKKVIEENDHYTIYDMKIAAPGKRPASGYLTIPRHAKPGSLPLEMHYDGYCVRSAQKIRKPDAICFFVNAHGIENGKDAAYYRQLETGDLSRYGFRNEENASAETTYFNGMILRDLRALEYARTLPEWDGKNITIHGGSQGAFQSIAVAGLADGIGSATVSIPWFCDISGVEVGRVRGWRPDYSPALNYYDTVNFAKRVKCPVKIVQAGLSDWVCPPSGVWILYNNLKVPKEMKMLQGLDHAVYPGFNSRTAQSVVLKDGSMK